MFEYLLGFGCGFGSIVFVFLFVSIVNVLEGLVNRE